MVGRRWTSEHGGWWDTSALPDCNTKNGGGRELTKESLEKNQDPIWILHKKDNVPILEFRLSALNVKTQVMSHKCPRHICRYLHNMHRSQRDLSCIVGNVDARF